MNMRLHRMMDTIRVVLRETRVWRHHLTGEGPTTVGRQREVVAQALARKVTSLAPIRNQLIAKGMIFSPSHGDTAFTVPLFDEFIRRIMPGDDWRE